MSKKIMLLGTASAVGKSTIAAAFCRYFKNKGLNTVPFKALNISLNSYVTEEGLEMGRAQVVQSEAAKIKPKAIMNPILLKPSSSNKTQVILNGKVYCTMDAYKYKELNNILKEEAFKSFMTLEKESDLVVLEGSGSCAEINLKDNDIANMYMAKKTDSPVILVSDIDRGGVFASVVGTIMLLDKEERKRVKGVIINKFRGNVEFFKPAMKELEEIIKIPVLGAMPYTELDIEDEDGVSNKLLKKDVQNGLDIAVIKLPHISNFTDLTSLSRFSGVSVRYVTKKSELKDPNIIILPGTKNTIYDLLKLKESGLFNEIKKKRRENKTIIFGICGGYQMLGNKIVDPLEVESCGLEEEGFGFLDMETYFNKEKITKHSKGKVILDIGCMKYCKNKEVTGYEIHNGESIINNGVVHFIKDDNQKSLGICTKDGMVFGTYLHGIFDSIEFSKSFIKEAKNIFNIEDNLDTEILDYDEYKDLEYEKLSKVLEENIDMKKVLDILDLKI